MKALKRARALGLCLALLAGSALAAELVNLGSEGNDCLYYKCSLPDGRFILAGSHAEPGYYNERGKARLLCMNPDGTVSWEYIDPEGTAGMFYSTVVTDDGRICTVFEDAPYQDTQAMSLKFFSLDGQPEGKPVPLDFSFWSEYWLTSKGLLTESYNYRTNRCEYTEFIAWNGRTLFHVRGGVPIALGPDDGVIAEDDGLVLYGREPASAGSAAKIMKVDYDGNTVWENVLSLETDLGRAELSSGRKTQDGGYSAWMYECSGDNYRYATVRFSRDGRVISRKEIFFDDDGNREKNTDIERMTECRGMYVDEVITGDISSPEYVFHYTWYDAEGNELGTTEVQIRKEDFPQFANGRDVHSFGGALIAAGDNLWKALGIWDETGDFEKTQASHEEYMFRVPMP